MRALPSICALPSIWKRTRMCVCECTMRAELSGQFQPCMTEIDLHIDARTADCSHTHPPLTDCIALHTGLNHILRVRLHIIGNARIKNVYKYQSCMVTKLPIICEQTVDSPTANAALSKAAAASGSAAGFRRSPRHMRAIFSAAVKICR